MNPKTSLVRRFLLLMGGSLILTILAFAAFILILSHAQFQQSFDQVTTAKAQALAAQLHCHILNENGKKKLSLDLQIPEDVQRDFLPGEHRDFYEIWLNNAIISTSYKPANQPLLRSLQTPERHLSHNLTLPNNKPGRATQQTFKLQLPPSAQIPPITITVLVARDSTALHNSFVKLLSLVLATGATLLTLAVIATIPLVNNGFKSLHQLGLEIDKIDSNELNTRLNSQQFPQETQSLINQLNSLFERLSQAQARERAFIAEVAHELRTPLAGLQTSLDVVLRRPKGISDYHQTLQTCQAIVAPLTRLVDQLLELSRPDSDNIPMEEIELISLVDGCWEGLLMSPQTHDATLEFDFGDPKGIPQIFITSNIDRLTLILTNVLQNALQHSTAPHKIKVHTEQTAKSTALTVSNSISLSQFQCLSGKTNQILQSFWRADNARTQTGRNFGLGLALANKVAMSLSIQLTVAVNKTLEKYEFELKLVFHGSCETS